MTSRRPSARNVWPEQKRSDGLGTAVKLPVAGFQICGTPGMAPSQHAPIGQQAQMKIDDWRGERRSPGADGRRIARHVECHGIGRRATGSSVVRPTGHPLVVHPELHRPLLDGLELGLAMGLVLLDQSRSEVETASLLGPDDAIHDADSARCGVRGEKLVATDVHQVDWTQHTPGRAALVLRRLGTRGRRLGCRLRILLAR